ncbi:DUF4153 domain-containing protein [Antarcticibacterium arcticum]|uniref:DUF4153 domain-containing protein n=1 Tax=Antarcticibacterium arcticum TaxID=2585771 RepID=A0A5B8YJY4_9FLAO|nr:DUF4153 domain-containing protein [Antarcticibacterium arcticum]QED38044.1 DUF4153 domain-containing protein [Antarcticibacterium arcticum]
MKDQIIINLNDPGKLERLYRTNKTKFRNEFNALSQDLKEGTLANFWNERLNYQSDEIKWGEGKDLLFIIIASLCAGLIAKIPAFTGLEEDFFYPRNIGFIIFPMLTAYFAWKNNISIRKIFIIIGTLLTGVIFINSLPNVPESDTLILACVHLPVLLWGVLGFAFVSPNYKHLEKRLGFLKYNGDLLVISALICIAGGILTGITIGLFSLLGISIEEFYFEYIVIFALPAVPILGTYLTQTNPHLVGKVSPVIARIFSPLVLVMLVIYLVAMVYSGKDPYNDREFLLLFNALLIGVMAIIFFSLAGSSETQKSKPEIFILILLSIVTILVNGIALSAILFRISEWGITPNRIAVLGANLLILINLILVTAKLLQATSNNSNPAGAENVIARYLPIYIIWAIIVTFGFPLIFGI